MSVTGFRFAYPALFALLIPVALYVVWSLKKKPGALVHADAAALGIAAGARARFLARVPLALRTLALVLLVLASARPQTYSMSRDVSAPGVDIILCLDASRSMSALDFTLDGRPVDRLTALKKVVSDFIKKRPYDRMGIVVLGTYAFTQAPLTLDKGLLVNLVENLEIGMAGPQTAVGDALALAGKRIKNVPAPSKIVILVTDGEETAGEIPATTAASALAALGVRIYTVGIGTTGRAPFNARTFFGDQVVYRHVTLDEKTLREIAAIGNGRYYNATDTEGLVKIYDEIDRAEKTEVKVKQFFHYNEQYMPFLVAALFILVVETAAFRLRALP